MSFLEFTQAVDLPPAKITKEGINKILSFSDDLALSHEKRLFLLDKLGFIARVDRLPQLIDLYYKYEQDEELSHMILRDTQDIYQQENRLIKSPKERHLLQAFYANLLERKLLPKTAPIVVRGFSSLSKTKEILANKAKVDQLLNSDIIETSTGVALKIALAFHSPKLEVFYIPDIINFLEKENKASLDILLAGAIVGRLANQGINTLQVESKSQLMNYLSSMEYKLETHINRNREDMVWPYSLGIWLEAKTLVSSSSYEEAARSINEYLSLVKKEDYKKYIPGFSRSKYMKNTFNTEPLLIDFKKENYEIYKNTVGLIK